jgi:hypothetical protein
MKYCCIRIRLSSHLGESRMKPSSVVERFYIPLHSYYTPSFFHRTLPKSCSDAYIDLAPWVAIQKRDWFPPQKGGKLRNLFERLREFSSEVPKKLLSEREPPKTNQIKSSQIWTPNPADFFRPNQDVASLCPSSSGISPQKKETKTTDKLNVLRSLSTEVRGVSP